MMERGAGYQNSPAGGARGEDNTVIAIKILRISDSSQPCFIG
jgi:hypothetical protein